MFMLNKTTTARRMGENRTNTQLDQTPPNANLVRSFQTSSSLKVVLLHLLRTTAHFLNTQIPTSSDHSVLVSQLTYCLVLNHGYRRKKNIKNTQNNNNDKKYTQQQSPSFSNTRRSLNKKQQQQKALYPSIKNNAVCLLIGPSRPVLSFSPTVVFQKNSLRFPHPCTS